MLQSTLESKVSKALPPRKAKNDTPARVIAITSGKGGVGKTHTTVNLGLALVKLGKKVLLLDADLGLANINVLLGFESRATIHDVLQGKATVPEIIVSHPSGLDIIPATSGVHELSHLSIDERVHILQAVDNLATKYDFMLIDTAAGVGSNVIYFNTAAHEVFVIIDQEPTSLTDAYALIKILATKHGIRDFSVIANRTPSRMDGRSVYSQLLAVTDRFLQVSMSFLGSITDDESVTTAIVSRRPFLELFPGAKTSVEIQAIAQRVVNLNDRNPLRGGMQFFFEGLLGEE